MECPTKLIDIDDSGTFDGKAVTFPPLLAINSPDLQLKVACNPNTDNNFQIGETSVDCVATDIYDNSQDCRFLVEVFGKNGVWNTYHLEG